MWRQLDERGPAAENDEAELKPEPGRDDGRAVAATEAAARPTERPPRPRGGAVGQGLRRFERPGRPRRTSFAATAPNSTSATTRGRAEPRRTRPRSGSTRPRRDRSRSA